jgi:uncharacterized repeat protein (TIGR03803 family)
MTKLNGWQMVWASLLVCAATAIAAPAQTFNTLADFDFANGAYPYYMSVVQGPDANLYGTTLEGGAIGGGTVFKITPTGTLTTLYSFCSQEGCSDGLDPFGGLVLATDGNFYGTTDAGGAEGFGTIFKITPTGTLTTLYSFCPQTGCSDGQNPMGVLIQATDGNFYGTTPSGGAKAGGTVFKITPRGKLSTLYSFCSQTNCTDGVNPYAGLVQAIDGDFYGTTIGGGAYGSGTVFSITTGGKLTTVHNFDGYDGALPFGGVMQAANGNFYGMTFNGGRKNDGVIFELISNGEFTVLYNFCALPYCPDGGGGYSGLIQGSDGNLYGTTYFGGADKAGTAFAITPGGALTTLYSFCSQGYPQCADGAYSYGGLLQATNGDFYGTTLQGGDSECLPPPFGLGCGTVFSLSVGLGPFVKTLPGSGKVGAEVGILGTALTGATGVSFNGTPAQFKVSSPTLILTHVPEGTTTGTVDVMLPSGTLSSSVPFYVLP